jgi:hypothetical protein
VVELSFNHVEKGVFRASALSNREVQIRANFLIGFSLDNPLFPGTTHIVLDKALAAHVRAADQFELGSHK